MSHLRSGRSPLAAALLAVAALTCASDTSRGQGFAPPADQEPPPGVSVLTRGPVHEAFAEPVLYDPAPAPIIPRRPPAPVEELPPDQRPEGPAVAWIPGYWGWDDVRDDFVWISGIWRSTPPGRQWVPGYWNQVPGGFQWVCGAWTPIEAVGVEAAAQVEYLPPPPATLEVGPNVAAPGPDYFWNPGCWYWQEARYAWRPGFWTPAQPNWVWVPPHYVWSPCGYLFVDGYWDYELVRRGVLFAPVVFEPVVIAQPQFVYQPVTVIDTTVITQCLFVRPTFPRYYFGDYFNAWGGGPRGGLMPWYAFHGSRFGYDPFYSHQRVYQERRDPHWDERLRESYAFRRDHAEFRPASTFGEQRRVALRPQHAPGGLAAGAAPLALARPIQQFASSRTLPMRFERVERNHRDEAVRQAQALRQLRDHREREELQIARRRPADQTQHRPVRLDLPRSPVAARAPADRPGSIFGRPEPTPGRIDRPVPGAGRPGHPGAGRPEPKPGQPGPIFGRPDLNPGRPGPRPEGDRPRPGRPVLDRPGAGFPGTFGPQPDAHRPDQGHPSRERPVGPSPGPRADHPGAGRGGLPPLNFPGANPGEPAPNLGAPGPHRPEPPNRHRPNTHEGGPGQHVGPGPGGGFGRPHDGPGVGRPAGVQAHPEPPRPGRHQPNPPGVGRPDPPQPHARPDHNRPHPGPNRGRKDKDD